MKKLFKGIMFAVALFFTVGLSHEVAKADILYINQENFPDKELRDALINMGKEKAAYDYREVVYDKALKEWYINTKKCKQLEIQVEKVTDFTGIEKLINLEKICIYDYPYDTFDLSFLNANHTLSVKFANKNKQKIKLVFGNYERLDELYLDGVILDLNTKDFPDIERMEIENSEGKVICEDNEYLDTLLVKKCYFSQLDLTNNSMLGFLDIEDCEIG